MVGAGGVVEGGSWTLHEEEVVFLALGNNSDVNNSAVEWYLCDEDGFLDVSISRQ